jgi:hypothetical protein
MTASTNQAFADRLPVPGSPGRRDPLPWPGSGVGAGRGLVASSPQISEIDGQLPDANAAQAEWLAALLETSGGDVAGVAEVFDETRAEWEARFRESEARVRTERAHHLSDFIARSDRTLRRMRRDGRKTIATLRRLIDAKRQPPTAFGCAARATKPRERRTRRVAATRGSRGDPPRPADRPADDEHDVVLAAGGAR